MKYSSKLFFLVIIIFNLVKVNGQDNLKEIKLALHWLPQAQFAGYYIGVEKGFYEKHGLEVKIEHASPNLTSQEMLLDGKADFASMFLSTAMFLRSYDYPLVNVCQLSQKCAQLFVTKKYKGYTSPADLNGKRIGIWRSGFDEIPSAFVNKYSIEVEFVLINSTANLFLCDGIDAFTTMWYNEYHTILNSGYNPDELNTFFFADYGLDVPEDGIYCLEENYDKTLTEKFVKATLEAWEYAFSHPEEAVNCVKVKMTEVPIPFNKPHQTWMFNRIKDLFNVKGKDYRPGELLEEDFTRAMDIFSSINKIKNSFKYSDFYFGIK